MKLYATTTSERASKGQGGNDFLEIRLKDDRENCFAVILVTKKETSFTPDIDLYSNGNVNVLETREEGFELDRDIENLKGEKQKGETCDGSGKHTSVGNIINCPICREDPLLKL